MRLALAGGHEEHPWLVKSSTTIGERGRSSAWPDIGMAIAAAAATANNVLPIMSQV
jgi:hypothetical protein